MIYAQERQQQAGVKGATGAMLTLIDDKAVRRFKRLQQQGQKLIFWEK